MDAGIGSITGSIAQNITGNAVQSAEQSSDDTFARKLEEAAKNKDDKALKQACQEFESIMLSMMYKQMKATVVKSDLMEKDPGMDIFQSMEDDELMKQASKTGSFGLAESLYKQLSRQYGKAAYAGVQGSADPAGTAQSAAATSEAGTPAEEAAGEAGAADNAAKSSKAGDTGADSSGDGEIIQESEPVSEESGK
jgi:flagellar protein FlgJ